MPGMVVLGVAAGLAASAAYNGGVILQALEARDSPRECGLRVSLLAALCRRKRWLLGTGLSILGFPLQVYAYANAPIAIVQSCLAAGLVLVLFLGAHAMDEPVRRRDYLAVGAITLGVALTAIAAPVRSEVQRAGAMPLLVLGIIGALAVIPYGFAARAAALPVAVTASAGLALAWNDVATKLFGDAVGGSSAVVAAIWLAGIVASAVIATLSEMTALQRSRATKVVPAVFVLEVFVPILLAPLLLQTHLPAAPLAAVGFYSGLLLVLAAIVVIATSDPVAAVMRRGYRGSERPMTSPRAGARAALSAGASAGARASAVEAMPSAARRDRPRRPASGRDARSTAPRSQRR